VDTRRILIVLAGVGLVTGATLAIAGARNDRLRRPPPARTRPLVHPSSVDGLFQHRFSVTVSTLKTWQGGPTAPLVVDVRDRAAYDAGHLSGALLRPARELLAGRVRIDAGSRQVVLYDQDGRLCPYLVLPLRGAGLDVYLLSGGYAAWVNSTLKPGRAAPVATPASTPEPASGPTPAAAPPPPTAPPVGSSGAPAAPAHEGC
jgi:rhodanese-related sulfurtransferase